MSQQQNVATDTAEAREKSQPNLAGYFLTVGLVTIAFGSVFSLVFSGTVTLVLVAVVIAVAIISVAAGLYSDSDLLFPEV